MLSGSRLDGFRFMVNQGRMKPLPQWTQHGAIAGLQGGSATVKKITTSLLEGGVGKAGLWLLPHADSDEVADDSLFT